MEATIIYGDYIETTITCNGSCRFIRTSFEALAS